MKVTVQFDLTDELDKELLGEATGLRPRSSDVLQELHQRLRAITKYEDVKAVRAFMDKNDSKISDDHIIDMAYYIMDLIGDIRDAADY